MTRLTVALLASLFPLASLASPLTYNFDPVLSFPTFTVNHLVLCFTLFEPYCRRRLKVDPPCRLNIDPGRVAAF